MNILFVAAENGALPGGKVGGIGDVIRDLPPALAALGGRVTVVTPSHGFLHQGEGRRKVGECAFLFRGVLQTADIYTLAPPGTPPGVIQAVIHHPALAAFDTAAGGYRIYTHDPPEKPYFTDASRFAFFGGAVAATVTARVLGDFDVLHLHDWHAAFVALLGRFHPGYRDLGRRHTVFSIHNLAFQGVRPLRGSESSLEAWFPEMPCDRSLVADPRWPDCLNPMAAGIRLADRVHTVSPTYAAEIRRPDRKPAFFGGEGLEGDLETAHARGRLFGILNGCAYPRGHAAAALEITALMGLVREEAIRWSGQGDSVPAAQFIAFARAAAPGWQEAAPDMLLTSVARVGEQKMLILRHPGSDGRSGLEALLEALGPRGCYVLLGSGEREYERWLTAVAARHANFIFVNGYSDPLADALYAAGDLFLMPSSFEPCGLSQMLAMRCGQPCLVHAVGGLKDTVEHGYNGFAFAGATLVEQVDAFVATVREAVALKRRDAEAWLGFRRNAAATRFAWSETAERYRAALYPSAAIPAAEGR